MKLIFNNLSRFPIHFPSLWSNPLLLHHLIHELSKLKLILYPLHSLYLVSIELIEVLSTSTLCWLGLYLQSTHFSLDLFSLVSSFRFLPSSLIHQKAIHYLQFLVLVTCQREIQLASCTSEFLNRVVDYRLFVVSLLRHFSWLVTIDLLRLSLSNPNYGGCTRHVESYRVFKAMSDPFHDLGFSVLRLFATVLRATSTFLLILWTAWVELSMAFQVEKKRIMLFKYLLSQLPGNLKVSGPAFHFGSGLIHHDVHYVLSIGIESRVIGSQHTQTFP